MQHNPDHYRREAQRFLHSARQWTLPEIGFWVFALAVVFLFPDRLSLAGQIAITGLFALSVDLILGYAGIVTLGHALYFGVGAYASALLIKDGIGDPILGLVLSASLSAILGLLTSFILLKAQHLALLMITLGLGLLGFELANSMAWLTGGEDGLRQFEASPVLGLFEFDLWGQTAYLYALAVLFLAFVVSRRLVGSPFGLTLRGIRENALRMKAIGNDCTRHLRVVFVISTFMAGAAGALLTQTISNANLQGLSFQRSADIVVMLVLGGIGRLYGAILGVTVYMIGRDQLSDLNPQYWYFWIGLLLMGIVLALPGGLLGGVDTLLQKAKKT